MATHSQGLSLVPKLKREHVQLTSFSRMRVDLAAQVSSCPPSPHTHVDQHSSCLLIVTLLIYMHMSCQLPQVLSKSVCDAFSYFGDPTTKETEKFILMMDRFFDCLNVRSLNQWREKRKPDLKPYTSVNDPRLKVLTRITNALLHHSSN